MRRLGPFRRVAAVVIALFLALQGGSDAVCDALYHAAADGHGQALTHVVHVSSSDRGHRTGGNDSCVFCQVLNHLGFIPASAAASVPPYLLAGQVPLVLVRPFAAQAVVGQHRARAPPPHSLLTA